MFKVLSEPTFTHSVDVMVPSDGGYRKETLKATYKVIAASSVANHDLSSPEGTLAFLQQAVVKLDDIADEAGAPITYSDAVRDQVLDLPYARRALMEGYLAAVTKAKAGN
jgi:hypothetical protein